MAEAKARGFRGQDADSGSPVADARSTADRFAAFRAAFWKFLRPHTIRGTILGATAITSRALLENQQYIDWGLLPRALLGVLALVCGNGYIVGINQIYDVSVDTVNKPYLPIAAGELSPALAWLLVMGLAASGLAITSTNFGSLITALYGLGLFLGTIYSVPPLHLKRFAVPAFLIIATVRGVLLNFGVYYAARAALGLTEFQWSPAIGFITAFVTVFATVIALTKDLPDIVGDRQHGIQTFATILGAPRLTALAVTLLLSNYIAAGVLAVRMPAAFRQQFMIAAHAVLAGLLLRAWRAVHMAGYSKSAIAGFYRAIWNLFYSEYFIFPLL